MEVWKFHQLKQLTKKTNVEAAKRKADTQQEMRRRNKFAALKVGECKKTKRDDEKDLKQQQQSKTTEKTEKMKKKQK